MTQFVRRSVPALLFVLLVLAPQAGGAVYRWCAVIVAATVLLMTGLALSRRSVWENTRVDATCWILTAMAALTVFQLVPLPFHLVQAVAPRVAALYADASALPLAPQRYFIPLTVDSSLTAFEALKWASYAALYVTILNWPRGGGHQLPKIAATAGALTAVVCLVESSFRIHSILGIYQPPVSVASWLRGPFVNPGHTGIYCAMLGTLTLGAAGEVLPRWRNWIRLLAGVLFLLALTALSGKTTVAVAVGLGGFFFLRARTANLRWTRGWPLAVAAAVVVIALTVVLARLPSPEQIRAMPDRYLAYRSYSRIIVWSDALRLLRDFPWTGVGRGAFGPAFTPYDTVNTDAVSWHAENLPLQLAAEWGIVPALAFMAAIATAVIRAALTARRPFPSAAAATLLMLGIVNLVDFDLELLGIGLTAIVCLGVLARKETKSVRIRQGHAAFMVPAGLIVAALVAMSTVGLRSLDDDVARLRRATAAPIDRHGLDLLASAAAVRHPADFFLPQFVAAEHLRLRASLGIVWLNRALALRPKSPEAHFLAGMALQRAGRTRQALLEYVLAARYLHRFVPPVGDAILRTPSLRAAGLKDLDWASKEDFALLTYLANAAIAPSSAAERFAVDERLLVLQPDTLTALGAIQREKTLAMQDPAMLQRLDRAITVNEGEVPDLYLVTIADIRARAGRLAEAEKILIRASSGEGSRHAVTMLVDLLLAAKRPDDAIRQLNDLQQKQRISAGEAEFLRAKIHEHRGNLNAAVDSYGIAVQYSPDDVDILVAAALAAHRASRADLELQYAHRALTAGHSDATVREKLAPLWPP